MFHAQMQVGFIEFIVRPLLEAYWGWLRSFRPVAEPLLLANIEYWKRKQAGDADTALRPDNMFVIYRLSF